MQVHTYLSFDGRCDAAIKFYEEAIGAKLMFKMTWGESPMSKDMPPETHKLIMHSTLAVGDGHLMCADAPPDHYTKPAGMSVSLNVKSREEGERIFNALSKNGTVTMPYQTTFWTQGFGMCVDQFGIPWMVNCDQPTA
jgi:PhnB protein